MDIEKVRIGLLKAERSRVPSQDVPYAFEKRVMAHIASCPALESITDYMSVLWKAAGSCACVMVLAFVVSFGFQSDDSLGNRDLESTVFASMSQHIEDSW
ncbi:MAG: hypothetical protein JWN25_477 [Verrucomicrobiales bacterium]|nr:hypothetical protein [Verrucomicrobiales bacterium]